MELFPLPENEIHLILSNDDSARDQPAHSLDVRSEDFVHALDSRSALAHCGGTAFH
jgi:hypothetical protein